jgi:hypothetical protein
MYEVADRRAHAGSAPSRAREQDRSFVAAARAKTMDSVDFPPPDDLKAAARDRLKGLPKSPNSGNVALRTNARRCRLCYSGSNVTSGGFGGAMELGLLSNSALNPSVYWTTLLPPLFSGLALQPGVQTIAPPPLAWERRGEWAEVRSQVKGCDALFWIQLAARPSGPIHVASYLNLGARRSNFVLDAWKPSLTKIGLVATVERLDPCFVAYREGMEELKRRFPLAKFVWLPFGASTEVFYPRKEEKSIFAFWLGRRYEPLHKALLAYCETRGLRYVYSKDGGLTTEQIGQLTSDAQYFVATPPDLDDPKRTGGFSPLVMRYFEGLAAGTRLLGVLPRSGEYQSILPTDAFCEVLPDGSDLAERLDEDRSNPNTQLAVDAAGAFVRENHSWRRRAEQVFNHLANGAAIEFPLMQKQRQIGRVQSRAGFRQDLAHDLKATGRFG